MFSLFSYQTQAGYKNRFKFFQLHLYFSCILTINEACVEVFETHLIKRSYSITSPQLLDATGRNAELAGESLSPI